MDRKVFYSQLRSLVILIAFQQFMLPVVWVYFILNLDEMIKLPAVY